MAPVTKPRAGMNDSAPSRSTHDAGTSGAGSSVGFACEGGPGTYLFAARVETRQRTIRTYAIENTDHRGAQDLQVAGDKVLMLVDFPKGGRVGVLFSCGGQHPVKVFGVEVYRVR